MKIQVGETVLKSEYVGVVAEVHTGDLEGMVEVRLERGTVVVPVAEVTRIERTPIDFTQTFYIAMSIGHEKRLGHELQGYRAVLGDTAENVWTCCNETDQKVIRSYNTTREGA